jgi:signal transduction histidine kinase
VRIAQSAALAVVYLAVARLGLQLDAVSGFATLVWPASGIALFALLRGGVALWPGIAVGAFAVNLWTGAPLPVALAIAAGNTLEAVVAAVLLRRLGFRRELDRVRDAVGLLAVAALLSTAVSATIGVTSLWLGDLVPDGRFGVTWRAWWLGDAIGILIVAPLLLVWTAPPWPRRDPQRVAGAVGLAIAAGLMGAVIFGGLASGNRDLAQPYLLFPFVIWAAVRYDRHGATAIVIVVSAIALAGTVAGHGPFVRTTLHQSLLGLQAFMAVVATTGLVLAAAIAERRAAERRAHEAIRIREDFLSVASHELRTPLTALVLRLTDVQHNLAERPASEDASLPGKIDRAVRSTAQLTHLIDDLLDVSRIAAGRLSLRRGNCDLAEIARDAVDHAAEEARRAGTELRIVATAAVRGHWDRTRIEQVLANLLSNAIKYGGGRPVEVAVAAGDGAGRVSVSDHGIGIAAVDQARIFDRFERAASVRNYGGLGLGLYITRQIVDAHGGTIRIDSQPGAGTTFTVELPADGPRSRSDAPPR